MNRANYQPTGAGLRLIGLIVLMLLPPIASLADLSEPDHLIYGQLNWAGEPITAGEVTLAIDAWPEPVASYELGMEPALGPQYALRIPMDTVGSRVPGTAREGDDAVISWNGEPVGMVVVGERGTAQRVDIDPDLQSSSGLLINNIAVSEGSAGTQTPASFTVTLTEPVEDTVSFDWVSQDGSAVGGFSCQPGVDYLSDSGAGQILPGQQQTQLTVTVCGNDEPDGDRDFFVELLNPDNAVLINPLGQAVILDTDTPPQISINNITILEPGSGEQTGTFSVSLTEPWDEPVSVDWATANGSATAGIDYIADSGVLTIPAGAQSGQIQVTVLANSLNQNDREFFVDLANPVNGTLLRDRGQALIVSASQTLSYVETQQDGVSVSGMSDPASVAVASPDGGHVYVASRTSDELLVFERDAGSGGLTPRQLIQTAPMLASAGRQIGGINGFAALAISPDGASVYAVSQADNAVVAFSRNDDPDDTDSYGRLSLIEAIFQGDESPTNPAGPAQGLVGARGVAVSPDGFNVYVAAAESAVAVFRRDPTSGALTYSEVEEDGVDNPNDPGSEVQGIGGAFGVAVSPDGQFVYVTGQSSDAVAVFARNQAGGQARGRLTFMDHYVNGIDGVNGITAPAGLAFSPDGEHLYVTGQVSNSLAAFSRQGNGGLEWIQAATAGTGDMQGLEEPRSVAVSPDGALVYVASLQDGNAPEPGTLAILRRVGDPGSPDFGRLTFDEIKRNQVGGIHGLWGATAVAASPDNAHVYVAARWDKAVTVFARDLEPPFNPTFIESTSHEIEQWHNDPVIAMTWAGAADGGSGVQGYSVLLSQNPVATPDDLIDVAHGEDPHAVDSDSLPDGDGHWFHLRTCDFGGNCSDPASVGPYWIDTMPPTAPEDVASSSHVPGEPSIPEAVIEMNWNPAADPGVFASGVEGYSYVFNTDPQLGPNEVINLEADASSVESDPLPSGIYYFHIRARDVAGNWSPPVTAGPFGVGTDDVPPQVQLVDSVASAEPGQIVDGLALQGAVTQVLVRFSEPMASGGPGNAGNAGAYRLVPDDGTPAPECAGTADAGLVDGVVYEPFAHTTRFSIASDTGLAPGAYVLLVCDELQDINGNHLDGTATGEAGGDYVLRFSVTRDNLLLNPNFDAGVAAWSTSSGSIIPDAGADADGHAVSGAVRFEIDAEQDDTHALSQCVSVSTDPGAGYNLRARVRMEEVGGGDPSPVRTFASIVFYSQSNCGAGSELAGSMVSNSVFTDTGGQWEALSVQTAPGASEGAASALISMNLDFPSSPAFPVRAWFDNTLFVEAEDDVPPSELPQVEVVEATRAYEWDDLNVGLPSERSFTQLMPVFTRGVFSSPGGLDPGAANNPDNYRVLQAAPGGSIQTSDCGAVSGGDTSHPISEVAYNVAERRAVLRFADPRALPAGLYRLIVCGTIRDFDGNHLDGSGNGVPGSDYLLDFEVASTNLLANPNLDSTVAPWVLEAPVDGGTLERGAADVDSHLSSGSLRAQHAFGLGALYRAAQCVNLGGQRTDLTLGAAVFVNQSAGGPPLVAAGVRFFDAEDCSGDEVTSFEHAEHVGHTAGRWHELISRLPDAPGAAQSAHVTFEVESDQETEAGFDLWLDHMVLRSGNADLIFRNRFTAEP